MRSSSAFLMGVGTAFFFDPRLGEGRRAVVRERGRRTGRQLARLAGKKARFAAGKAQGYYARAHRLVTRPEVASDDATVEQRIRSQALREVEVSPRDIEVEVENGVASVKGPVPDDDVASDLVARVSKVAGVEEVAAMLYVTSDEPDERAG